MILKDYYNKISGTEFRVKNPANGYFTLFNWINDSFNTKNTECTLTENEFITWAKENGYEYNKSENKNNIKRFPMSLGRLSNCGLLSFEKIGKDGYYKIISINDRESKIQSSANFGLYMLSKYVNPKTNEHAYSSLLEFLSNWNKDPKEIDVNKVIMALYVYDGKESFNKLYEIDIIEDIISKESEELNKIPYFKEEKDFKKFFHYKKPPKGKQFPNNITMTMKTINNWSKFTESEVYKLQSETCWKFLLFGKKKFNAAYSTNKMNELSKIDFCELIKKEKLENLLLKEYSDVVRRWLFGTNLLTSSSKNASFNQNIKKLILDEEKIWKISTDENEILRYPWSKDQVSSFLYNIQKNKFEDKFKLPDKTNNNLEITNSTWAEYMVNLAFAYMLNIEPKDFTKYSRTKVDEKLMPQFTASGGGADFEYEDAHKKIIVETTIHKYKDPIIQNEVFPAARHIDKYMEEKKKSYFWFISYLENEKDRNKFLGHLELELTIEKKDNLISNLLNFNSLSEKLMKDPNIYN